MYFNLFVSLSLIGTKVEFVDQLGTYLLKASISSSVTLYKAFAPSTTANGTAAAVAPKPTNLL